MGNNYRGYLSEWMTANDCGFNRSMQHLISKYIEEDVENERTAEKNVKL